MKQESIIMGSVYHWMISNLPFRIMYKHVWIDTQHKMWLPRWGWSKRQIADAEKKAKELARKKQIQPFEWYYLN